MKSLSQENFQMGTGQIFKKTLLHEGSNMHKGATFARRVTFTQKVIFAQDLKIKNKISYRLRVRGSSLVKIKS